MRWSLTGSILPERAIWSMQEAGEMQERASLALSQIRSELQKAGPSARLQLTVQSGSSAPRVQVVLQCDSYSDVMATSAQVDHRR